MLLVMKSTLSLCRYALAFLVVMCTHAAYSQCPNVTIHERVDHRPSRLCRANGWDTVVNCRNKTIVMNADLYVTTQHFNGTYLVEEIPYNPPESFTFGTRMPIGTDDDFGPTVQIRFPFCFFGYQKSQITLGANGLGTFTSGAGNQDCPWSYSAPLPWPNNTSGAPDPLTHMRDAIYGVYEDTYPPAAPSPRGIYYGTSPDSDYPCRHICFSWNHVPQFNHSGSDSTTHNCTYQIVIYEGSNVVEVHVADRMPAASWNGQRGLIGIQNATGTTQESHYHDVNYLNQPSYYVNPNSPPYFAPDGFNVFTTAIHHRAWRFTPQGETQKNVTWWRLIERPGDLVRPYDTVEFSFNADDTNGFYMQRDKMRVSVTPTRVTKYLVKTVYQCATGDFYQLQDTILVGVDTAAESSLLCEDSIICEGHASSVNLIYPTTQQTLDSCTWHAEKVFNGVRTLMPASAITDNFVSAILRNQAGSLTPNHIDTVYMFCTAQFKNGCRHIDSVMINTYPNYEFYDTMGICQGSTYAWCGHNYTYPGDYTSSYESQTMCDSIMHLHLMNFAPSHTIDTVLDCAPHTWINGVTYSASNDDTRAQDTVLLHNDWGCDSVVSLDFTFIPMKAIISHTPEVATLDDLTIELTDQSYGHDSRKWLMPDGTTSTGRTTYVNFPLTGIDSMRVQLAVHNNYGCDDTAAVVIPLHKVAYYVPNVFTPDRNDNNRFYPTLRGNVSEVQVWILDRRGQQVYYFKGPDGYWDGTDVHGGRCPQGSYVYIMRYRHTLEPNVTQEVTGTITLVR